MQPDDTSWFGVPVSDLIEPHRAPNTTEFHWRDADVVDTRRGSVSYHPGPSTTSMSIGIEPRSGAIHEREYFPLANGNSPVGGCDGASYEFPVTATLETADNALGVRFAADLRVSTPRVGWLATTVFPLTDNQGDFAWFPDDVSSLEGPSFKVQAQLWNGGSAGWMRAEFEQVNYSRGIRADEDGNPIPTSEQPTAARDDSGPPEPYDYEGGPYVAQWPTSLICDSSTAIHRDAAISGVSAAQIVDVLRELDLTLATETGEVYPLAIEFDDLDEYFCGYATGNFTSFWIEAHATTATLGLNATFPFEVRAETSHEGDLVSIRLTRFDYERPFTPEELETTLGFPIDGSGSYDKLYWMFQGLYLPEESGWAGSGEFLVQGVKGAAETADQGVDAGVAGSSSVATFDSGLQQPGNDPDDAGTSASSASGASNEFEWDPDESWWPTPPGQLLYRLIWSSTD